ncbi:signal peptidase I [bacterium]|nr:signal peptidase I [bacterium]
MALKKLIFEFVETLVTSFILVLVLYATVASMEVVLGSSMEPNFFTGERILVEKVTKYFGPYQRGDIVVLIPPDEDRHYIKRVVGVPGDIIKILDCKVYISQNGEKYVLDETYLGQDTCTTGKSRIKDGRALRVGEGEYVVLGDNREVFYIVGVLSICGTLFLLGVKKYLRKTS